ncbi:phage integrase SAM-like domain-containing protein [Pedobacter nutrimenti]|uniref:phage integrase SAM-like domain-containing protein n=1 Tax=Pedobacter nutrimenti TaxID=1241337 RepID=UPI0039776124
MDFIKFSRKHIKNLIEVARTGTASNQTTVVNSLCDYLKRKSISINEIYSNMLTVYKKWLRSNRTMIRINQLGKPVETTEKGLKDGGIITCVI